MRKPASLDSQRSRLRTWLFSVARNQHLLRFRKRARQAGSEAIELSGSGHGVGALHDRGREHHRNRGGLRAQTGDRSFQSQPMPNVGLNPGFQFLTKAVPKSSHFSPFYFEGGAVTQVVIFTAPDVPAQKPKGERMRGSAAHPQ